MQYIERKLAKKGGKIISQFGQGLLSGDVIHFFQTGIPIRIPQKFQSLLLLLMTKFYVGQTHGLQTQEG